MKSIGNRKLLPEEIDWSPLRNWGSESLRTDAKNCFYPIIVQDDSIVGFGDVSEDSFHPTAQTEIIDGKYYIYPIDSKGVERKWRYARQTVESIIHLLKVKKTKVGLDIEIGKDFGTYKTVWTDSRYDANVNGTQLLKSIISDTTFSYPKSIYTVLDCIYSVVNNDKNAIILDFFGGSGTTGHAVMEINKDGGNRKFILVEQMDYIKTVTSARVKAVIDKNQAGSFVYCELAQLNQTFVEAIQSAKNDEQLASVWAEMRESSFISSYVKPQEIDPTAEDFNTLSFADKKRLFLTLLDKNMLYVNYCDIDDENYAISDEDKAFTHSFYKES